MSRAAIGPAAAVPAPPANDTAPPLSVSGAMRTDRGRVRAGNEDHVAWSDRHGPDGAFLGAIAVVCDGMGGHAAGEVASAIAVETVVGGFWTEAAPPAERLGALVEAAHAAILAAAGEQGRRGMGSTCTALAFLDGRAFLAHVGDSRAYLLRDGLLEQLSEDQTYVAQLVRDGLIGPDEAKTHPDAHVILQALGGPRAIVPFTLPEGLALRAGDRFILCSDGLTQMVEDELIRDTCSTHEPQAACEALICAANAAGGLDNISVGVFVVGGPAAPAGHRTTRRMAAFQPERPPEAQAASAEVTP